MNDLKQGDIVFTDLFPTVGHEQSGERPVLVISNNSCKSVSNLTMVCPITSTDRKSPAHIKLMNTKTKGVVLCDQVRALDLSKRDFKFFETLDADTLWDVIDSVNGLIEIL